MDKVAPIVLDVMLSPSNAPPPVLNVIHPHPVTWHTLMAKLADNLPSGQADGSKLKLIPFMDWIAALESKASTLSADEMHRFVSLFKFLFLTFYLISLCSLR